jgi:hypothetical protein
LKVCTVRRRVLTSEAVAGTVTIYTEPGFGTPKAMMCYYSECNANTGFYDTATSVRNLGVGIAGPAGDGTSTIIVRTQWMTTLDGITPTSYARRNDNTRFIRATNNGGTNYYQCTAVSFSNGSAGLTFTATTPQTNINLDLICIFFTGSDLTVGVGNLALGTATNNTASISTLNFTPDCLITNFNEVAANSSQTTQTRFSLGAAIRLPSIKQSTIAYRTTDRGTGLSTQTYTYVSSTSCAASISTTAGALNTYSLTSWNANGFTITSSLISATGTSNNLIWLALKGASGYDFMLTDYVSGTSTGDQYNFFGSNGSVPQMVMGAVTGGTSDAPASAFQTSPDCESVNLFASEANEAPYNVGAGSITSNTGSSSVSGTGTTFKQFNYGDILYSTSNQIIGTVSSVTNDTSLTLTASATTAVTSAGYNYYCPRQFCLTFGEADNVTPTNVFSKISTNGITIGRNNAGTIQDLITGTISNFGTRPGYNVNLSTADATGRRGWVLGFKDPTPRRRNPAVS